VLGRTPTDAGQRGPSPPTPALALVLVLLLGAAAVGLSRLPAELSDQSHAAASGRAIPSIDSLPVLSQGPRRTAFLAYVRRTVPAGDAIRIVQPITPLSPLETRRGLASGVCGYSVSRVTYFYLQYALGPRPSTCDPGARWTMYFGVRPGPLPVTASAHRYADGYVLVRR
jgi:hypothetical protein